MSRPIRLRVAGAAAGWVLGLGAAGVAAFGAPLAGQEGTASAPPDRSFVRATLQAELRTRAEGWSDFGFVDEQDDSFVLGRLLVATDVRVGRYFRAFIRARSAVSTDRDLPGGRRRIDADDLDLQDAFLDIIFPLADQATLTLRGGRQGLLFGKQRLVSPLDWANTQRTFDGVSAILSTGSLKFHGFWTRPVTVRKKKFNESSGRTEFFGLYATDSLRAAAIGVDAYWLFVDRDSAAVNGTRGHERRHTIGARVGGSPRSTGLFFDAETAYQFGSLGGENISAFMLTTEVGVGFALPAKPRLRAGFDFATGDGSPGGSAGTFDQLFPLVHAFLGFADVAGRRNVVDLRAGTDVRPTGRLSLGLTAHHLRRARAADALYSVGGAVVRLPQAGTSTALGNELDLTARYRLGPYLSGLFGYSHFFTGRFIEESGPHRDLDFFYLSLTARR